MFSSLLLSLALTLGTASAVEPMPPTVSTAGPNLGQAKGALEKVKSASDPVTTGKARVVVLMARSPDFCPGSI